RENSTLAVLLTPQPRQPRPPLLAPMTRGKPSKTSSRSRSKKYSRRSTLRDADASLRTCVPDCGTHEQDASSENRPLVPRAGKSACADGSQRHQGLSRRLLVRRRLTEGEAETATVLSVVRWRSNPIADSADA